MSRSAESFFQIVLERFAMKFDVLDRAREG